jgi:hypothetical protein
VAPGYQRILFASTHGRVEGIVLLPLLATSMVGRAKLPAVLGKFDSATRHSFPIVSHRVKTELGI